MSAAAEETARRMLAAFVAARDSGGDAGLAEALSRILRDAFNEVSAVAWRDALTTFAGLMEQGMEGAYKAGGINPQSCAVDVTDVIMLARGMAEKPKQVPDVRGEVRRG